MYVCLCLGVTDRDVRRAVDGGACTAAEVIACTGAGTRCGTCRSTVGAIVAAHADAQAPAPSRRHLELVPLQVLARTG
jgi:bacterioferritin-associated ferredoxin